MIPAGQLVDPWSTQFIDDLVRQFRSDWAGLLRTREELRRDPRGHVSALRGIPTPEAVREPGWRVHPVPLDLVDRRVEITGPGAEPRMALHALRSGASGYMVDGEDSLCPTWDRVLATHSTLTGITRRSPSLGELPDRLPTLHYRPRGLHLTEGHWHVDGEEAPAALVDAGLYLWWNAREALVRGRTPALYLPKLEGEWEARWWHRVLRWTEDHLEIPRDSVRVTVLVETLPCLLRLEETVWALRDRLAGLNVGRWDYIFSAVKVLSRSWEGDGWALPDRSRITMDTPGLHEYARWVVRVAHSRGTHAIGGMAAQVPNRRDPAATAAAHAAVLRDKERELTLGHDGTWVAHPDLVPLALRVWEEGLHGAPHQREVLPPGPELELSALFAPPGGSLTPDGVREAARTALRYWAAWLDGNGCVALDGRMEDAATAEISVALLWHWLHRGAELTDGTRVTAATIDGVVRGETEALIASGGTPRAMEAADLVLRAVIAPAVTEFVLSEAYARLRHP